MKLPDKPAWSHFSSISPKHFLSSHLRDFITCTSHVTCTCELYSHVPEKSIAALGLTECPLESREGDRCAEQEGGGLGSPGNARSVQTQFRISLCTSAVVDDCSSQIDPYLHNLTWLPPLSVCLPTVYLISWLWPNLPGLDLPPYIYSIMHTETIKDWSWRGSVIRLVQSDLYFFVIDQRWHRWCVALILNSKASLLCVLKGLGTLIPML